MRVALVRFSSLGDVIRCMALPRQIRRALPAAEVFFVVAEEYASLLRGHPDLAAVIGFDRRQGWPGLRAFAQELRARNIDVCIDLHGSLRSVLLGQLLEKRTRRLRATKHSIKRLLLLSCRWDRFRPPCDRGADFAAAARALGVEDDGLGPRLFPRLDPSRLRDYSDVIRRLMHWRQRERPVIGLAPEAAWQLKTWPEERVRQFVDLYCGEIGGGLLIFGGPQDRLPAALQAAHPRQVVSLAGRSSYLESAWFAARLDRMICGDTGMMHMAEAVGVEVIALFGATTHHWGFFPWRQGSVVLQRELACRPCTRTGSGRCGHPWERACLRGISAEEVLRALVRCLDAHPPRHRAEHGRLAVSLDESSVQKPA